MALSMIVRNELCWFLIRRKRYSPIRVRHPVNFLLIFFSYKQSFSRVVFQWKLHYEY